MIGFLASRNLVRSWTRTLLLWGGITVSGALLYDMVMLSGGLEASFRSVLREMNFDVRMTPRGSLPFNSDVSFPDGDRLLRWAGSDARVQDVRGFYGTTLYVSRPGRPAALGVFAIAPTVTSPEVFRLRAGVQPEASRADEMGLSPVAAARLGATVGDTVWVTGPEGEGLPGAAGGTPLRVRGIGNFRFDTRSQGSVLVPLGVARALRRDTAGSPLSLVALRLRRSSDAPAVARDLRARFAEAEVYEVSDLVSRVRRQVSYFNQFSSILGALSFGIAWLLIATLLTLSLNDRLGEMAVLRAIGLRPSRLVLVMLTESLAFVAVSVPSSLLVGLLTARWLDALLLQGPGLPADLHFFVATPGSTVRTVLLLFFAGTLGALVPMLRVAGLPVAATLHESAA